MSKFTKFAGRFLSGLILLVLLTIPAHAEVGVIEQIQGPTSYILQSIVDEPEPIDHSAIWVRYSATAPGRRVLNEGGYLNGDGRPSLVTDPASHFPIVAWAKNSPTGFDIVISRFDGTDWTTPQIVAGSPADELDPHLSIDPGDGSIHLVYWIHDASPRVLWHEAPADLSTWSPATQVSATGDLAVRPSGVFHDGQFRVAYELHDLGYGTTPRQIVLATRNGPGFSSQILTTTQYAGDNWPSVHSSGDRLWVDWIDTDFEMTWIRKIQGAPWGSVEIEFFQTPEEREFHVRGLVRQKALE
jgi:hypothetical protein